MLVVTIIPIWMILKGFDLAVIIAVTLAINGFSTIFRPAARSVLPKIVPSEWIQDANGLMSAAEALANSASLALGGALIVAVGTSLSLFYNSLTYFISAVMIFLIIVPSSRTLRQDGKAAGPGSETASASAPSGSKGSIPPFPPSAADDGTSTRKTSFTSEVREGMRYMIQHKGILEMTLVASIINFFLTMSLNFLVVYATKFLLGGGLVYMSLLASYTLGSAAGAIVIGKLNPLRYAGRALIWINVIFGFSTLAMVLLQNVFFAGIMLFVTGFSIGLSNSLYISVIQTIVPGNFLGRVISVDEVGSFATIPLAQIAGGLLIQAVGIVPDIEVAGAGLIVTALSSFLLRDYKDIRVEKS
jgi:hypothetical protein